MLWIIILILVVLWALGFFGSRVSSSIPRTGNLLEGRNALRGLQPRSVPVGPAAERAELQPLSVVQL